MFLRITNDEPELTWKEVAMDYLKTMFVEGQRRTTQVFKLAVIYVTLRTWRRSSTEQQC
jgi:hypothetical protein